MLDELVKVLEDRRTVMASELPALNERRAVLRAELEKLDREAAEKEHQLAAITSTSINEYRAIWKSYTPPNPFPCPLCFVFQKKLSPLEPLSRAGDVAPVKCRVCQETFQIPIELLYA